MKLRISIVFIIFCAIYWSVMQAQCSLSCVGTFFREKNIKTLSLIDRRSDLPLEAIFNTSDWTVTVTSDEKIVVDSNVLITVSVANFRDFASGFTMGNAYVILTDEDPSPETISGIFFRFQVKVRGNVVIMGKSTASRWHLYRFSEFQYANSSANPVQVFAECANSHLTHLLNDSSRERKWPLTIAVKKYEPFAYYDASVGFHKGIDYSLVKSIAERLELDVHFIRADADSVKLVF